MKNKFLSFIIAFAVFVGIGAYIPSQKAHAATSKTQAQAVEWLKSLIGTQAKDMDGMYGAQCVDFIQHYYSWLGVYGGGGNACDYAWNTLPSGFTRIEDYYGFVPDPGDIAVWTVGSGGVSAGHVGVVISADLSTLTVADVYGSVNETPYRKVHQTTYYYNGGGMTFWGIIRPNFASASSSTPVQSFDKISEGTYLLYNRATDLALNLGWNNDANCENVHAYTYCTTNRGELMSITSCSSDWKTYKIRPIDAKRLVQMYGESPYNGVNVCIYDDLANSTQWWRFKKVGNGYAILIDCNTSYALSSVSGDAVLNTYTGAGNQIWELISYNPTYTVNYNANGGSGSMSSETFSVGRNSNLAANKFTRSGYTFQGWAKSAGAASAAYSDTAVVADLAGGAASVTLYAVWKANPVSAYTIKYDGNGRTSGYMDSVSVNSNTSVNLQKNKYEKFGYRFKGWSTDKNAKTAQYTDGQSVKNLAQSGTVTLYAIWESIDVPPLKNIKTTSVTTDSIILSWDALDVDGYDIWKDDVYFGEVTSNSITITGLKPSTAYKFSVVPYITGSSGAVGCGITVTTLSSLHAATGSVAAEIVSNSSNNTSVPTSSKDIIYGDEAAAEEIKMDTPGKATTSTINDIHSDKISTTVAPSGNNSLTTLTGNASNSISSGNSSTVTPSENTSTSAASSGNTNAVVTTPDGNSSSVTPSNNTNASVTPSSSNSTAAPSGNTSATGMTSESTGTTNNSDKSTTSENSAAQTAGVGAVISTSIWALISWLKKLAGK